jgi:hypothetical protein
MDVWIMNTDPSSLIDLEKLRKIKGTKCCWTNKETGHGLSKYFTGFARIIEYADYQRNGASPEYAFKISEGQIKNGKSHGFNRIISGLMVEFWSLASTTVIIIASKDNNLTAAM